MRLFNVHSFAHDALMALQCARACLDRGFETVVSDYGLSVCVAFRLDRETNLPLNDDSALPERPIPDD